MRFAQPLTLAASVLLLSLLACGGARAELAAADRKAAIAAICEPGGIKGEACQRARDYPEGKSCDVNLTGEGGEGRFLGGTRVILIAVYHSDCESHATNWGGSLVFEKSGGKLTFHGYLPALAFSGCLTLSKPDSADRLACVTGWMGQGYQSETIIEVTFAEAGGKVTASFVDLVSAGKNEDALGTNTVQCGKAENHFSFGELSPGPRPDTVAFEMSYAEPAQVKALCARPGRTAKLGNQPPPENEAYIP